MVRPYLYILLGLVLGCGTAENLSAQNPVDSLRLTLEDCRTRALAENENLKKADNASLQSRIDKQNAFASYLPQIDGSAMSLYTQDIDMSGTKLLLHGTYMAGFSFQQPLYAGGRIKAGNDLAKIGFEVSRLQQVKTRQEVILEADQAYWGYVAVLQKVRMLESYVSYIQAIGDKVQTSVGAELATKSDMLRVQSKMSEIKYNLQKARNGAELCRLVLCNAIGADFDTPIVPVDAEVTVEAPSAMDENVNERPEVQMLQQGIAAKKKQVKMELGEYLPTLAILGGWTYTGNIKLEGTTEYQGQQISYSQTKNQGFWYGAASLSIPLWNWGKSWRSVKKAKLDVENAELDLQRNSRLLTIQARQAIQNVTSGYSLIESAQIGLDQATENLRMMKEKYDADYCTLTDLLDAQSQWQQAESNLIEAKTQYRIYQTEYLKAVGRL